MKSSSSHKCLLLAALLCSSLINPSFAATAAPKHLKVFTCEQDGVIHFYVQNLELATVTATFDMRLLNLKGSANFPYTTTLGGNQIVEAFSLAPVKPQAPWDYSYVHSSVIGSADAVPDDACVYSLPYAPGSSFCVSQGYHGRFSHHGPDEFAIDWRMPVGTPVHAAREGIVVQSRDDMDQGGPSPRYEKFANCILIQHPDGTIGIYGHLKQGGNRVKAGDHVNAGDLIALSGNTGYSNGPHLHFSVFKAKDGRQRLSLPVKFLTAEHGVASLQEGQPYTAAPIEMLPDHALPYWASTGSPTSLIFPGVQPQ